MKDDSCPPSSGATSRIRQDEREHDQRNQEQRAGKPWHTHPLQPVTVRREQIGDRKAEHEGQQNFAEQP